MFEQVESFCCSAFLLVVSLFLYFFFLVNKFGFFFSFNSSVSGEIVYFVEIAKSIFSREE